MKRPLALALLVALVGVGACWWMRAARSPEPMAIIQSSEVAIINVDSEEMAQELLDGTIQLNTAPGTKTLIRVTTGNPTVLDGKLTASGSVYVINPHGVVVGPDAIVEIDSTLEVPWKAPANLGVSGGDAGELMPSTLRSYGNGYALAINEDGAIKATQPISVESLEDKTETPPQSTD